MTVSQHVLPLLTLVAVDIVSILSPGPGILLVTQAAIDRDRRSAGAIALGLAVAGCLWAAVAVAGLAALFDAMPALQAGVRYAGAAYLLYLGVKLWRRSGGAAGMDTENASSSFLQSFRTGFLTSLFNPKLLAYFGSIFVLLLPAGAPRWVNVTAVVIVLIDGLLIYGGCALLFSTRAVRDRYVAIRGPVNRIFGALLILLGGRLLVQWL